MIGYYLLQFGHINFPVIIWVLIMEKVRQKEYDGVFSKTQGFANVK